MCNAATSAGLTPLIRAACPKFSGRTAASFSLASSRRPVSFAVIYVRRYPLGLHPAQLLNLLLLTGNVPGVFNTDLYLFKHRCRQIRPFRIHRCQICVGQLGGRRSSSSSLSAGFRGAVP